MFFLVYFFKVYVDIFARALVQFRVVDLFGEVSDVDGVIGVQLLYQEVVVGAYDVVDLVYDGVVYYVQYVFFVYGDGGSVGEFDEAFYDRGVDVFDGYYFYVLFAQFVGEYGFEDGVGGGQYYFVGYELGGRYVFVFYLQRDVVQLLVEAQFVYDVERLFGVVFQRVVERAVVVLRGRYFRFVFGGREYYRGFRFFRAL